MADVTVYLKHEDDTLKYSLDDTSFQEMKEDTVIYCNSGDLMTWQVSSHDTNIKKLKGIKICSKKNFSPPKGHWQVSWEMVPTMDTEKEVKACPIDDEATKENPAFFPYDIIYFLNDGTKVVVDPSTGVPQQ